MLMADMNTVKVVTKSKVEVKYQEITEENAWKPNFVQEIVDILYNLQF